MAVTRWNFPNGTQGDALTPALAGADTVNFSGGTAVLSDSHALDVGLHSTRMTGTGAGHLWFAKEGLSATSYAVDCYVYIPTDGAVGSGVYVLWAGIGSSGRSAGITLSATRTLRLTTNEGMNAWSSSALPLDTLVRISLYVTAGTAGSGTARVAWYLGHETTAQSDSGTLTGLDTQSSIDRIRVGAKAATSSFASDFFISSWAYDPEAAGLIGPQGTPPDPEPSEYPEPIPGVTRILSGGSDIVRVMYEGEVLWPWEAGAIQMTVDGSTFSPRIELIPGATATVQWLAPGATVTGTNESPTFTWATSEPRTVRLLLGDRRELESLNLGFDNTQDPGRYYPDVSHNHPPQPITEITNLRGYTGLKQFMAANTPLSGTLDLDGCPALGFVECFGANLDEVKLEGATSLIRLCLENNNLTTIDVNPVKDTLRDLRVAAQRGGSLEFAPQVTGDMTKLYHFCVRGQQLVNPPTLAQFPVIEQWWVWNCGLTSAVTPTSTVLNSCRAHGNNFPESVVDNLLTYIDNNVAGDYGSITLQGSAPPSATGMAAVNNLLTRPSWTVTVEPAIPSALMGWELTTANTGLNKHSIDGPSLPLYTGPEKPAANTTITEQRITTGLDVSNGGITLERCYIAPDNGQGSVVMGFDNNTVTPGKGPVIVRDCTITGVNLTQQQSAFSLGIQAYGTFTGNLITDLGSGIGVMGVGLEHDTYIEGNYVTNLTAWGDPGGSGNHSDAFTIRDYSNSSNPNRKIEVLNNRFDCESGNDTGACFIQTFAGDIDNARIEGNYLEGGGYNFGINEMNGNSISNFQMIDNRFRPTGWGAASGDAALIDVWQDNYIYDAGQPNARGAVVPIP